MSNRRGRILLLVVVIACYALLPVTAALATDDGNQGDQSTDQPNDQTGDQIDRGAPPSGDEGSGDIVAEPNDAPPVDSGNDGSVDGADGDVGSSGGGDQGGQGDQGGSGNSEAPGQG